MVNNEWWGRTSSHPGSLTDLESVMGRGVYLGPGWRCLTPEPLCRRHEVRESRVTPTRDLVGSTVPVLFLGPRDHGSSGGFPPSLLHARPDHGHGGSGCTSGRDTPETGRRTRNGRDVPQRTASRPVTPESLFLTGSPTRVGEGTRDYDDPGEERWVVFPGRPSSRDSN